MASATIADVAKKAGVSTMTVSRAINNKGEITEATRQKVLQVAAELGYRPNRMARGLATKQTMQLGLVVPDITNPFFSQIALGAQTGSRAYQYQKEGRNNVIHHPATRPSKSVR